MVEICPDLDRLFILSFFNWLWSPQFVGKYWIFRKIFGWPQKSEELSGIEISAFYRKHHKKSSPNFPLPGTDKRQSFRALRPLSSNYNSKCEFLFVVVVVVKLMHNCHFVQLAVFVLKKFLFSSRQQKSWLFFDNQQPRSMSPTLVQKQLLKMLLYFHLGIFIATQCLGDFLAAIVALTYSILDCMDYPGMTQYTGCF